MKRICSNKEKLSSWLEDLEYSEIQKVPSINRENLLRKLEKQNNNDSLTLAFTYQPG